MLNEIQLLFGMEEGEFIKSPQISELISNGNVLFYTYGNPLSLAHIQLMDGTLICKRKIKFADGSTDTYMTNDGKSFYVIVRNHSDYSKKYDIHEISNPIKCKHCQKWFEKHFKK